MSAQPHVSLYDPDPPSEPADQGLTVEAAIDQYLAAKSRPINTRREYWTTQRSWLEWSTCPRSTRPMSVTEVTSAALRDFLAWVLETAVSSGGKNPENTRNARRRNMHAVFAWLFQDREAIEAMPRFPAKLEQREVAGQYFFTDDEMDQLYWSTYAMRRPRGWGHRLPIGAYWRTALCWFRSFGFDTAAIFLGCDGKECLRWRHVFVDPLPPGRVANISNAHGWIRWVRTKTGKRKQPRVTLYPLDAITRAHLDAIRPAEPDPEAPIFVDAGRGRPCSRVFQPLCATAKIPAKIDPETCEVVPYHLKDLRKTCATVHGAERGALFLSHAAGTITAKHYASAIPAMIDAMAALTHPRSFHSILDESIRPPGMLLAK